MFQKIIRIITTGIGNTILLCAGAVLMIANRFVNIPETIVRIGGYLFLIALILRPVTNASKKVIHKQKKMADRAKKAEDGLREP